MTESLPLVCCTDMDDYCVELTLREWSVCNSICKSKEPISFSQLKQESSLHQEILSRILKRLLTHHVIERQREDGRYRRKNCTLL